MKDKVLLSPNQLDNLKTLYRQAGPDTALTSNTLGPWRTSVSEIIDDLPWPPFNASDLRSPKQKFRSMLDEMRHTIREVIINHEPTFEDLPSSQMDDTSVHPQLWLHVKHNIEHQQWAQVASGTSLFVEDALRKLLEYPRDNDGHHLNPQALFARALNDKHFRLGDTANDYEGKGWRQLGLGFVAAIGNIDRHNIQERPDIKVYAMGVLGLGSLLLTQIEHDHPNLYRPPIGVEPWAPDKVAPARKTL